MEQRSHDRWTVSSPISYFSPENTPSICTTHFFFDIFFFSFLLLSVLLTPFYTVLLCVDLLASCANGLAFRAKLFTFHNRVVRPECELFNPNTTDTLIRIILARNSQVYPVFFSICCNFMSKVFAKNGPLCDVHLFYLFVWILIQFRLCWVFLMCMNVYF